MGEESTKITADMNQARLTQNLAKYREKAIEHGASKAELIMVKDIPVEDRVVTKCRVPQCWGYGISANCPPHALKPSELRASLNNYDWAVLFAKHVPTEILLRDRTDKDRIAAFRAIYDIVRKVESMAFYDGHYLAFGLAAGSCRRTFCGEHDSCQVLEGKACRFPLLARPSMEAVGINVYKLVALTGWDIYPIGSHATTKGAPKAMLAGLVIIQ